MVCWVSLVYYFKIINQPKYLITMTKDKFVDILLEKYTEDHVIQDDKYFYFYKHIALDEKNLVLGVFDNTQLKYNYADNFNDPYDALFHFELENLDNLTKEQFEDITDKPITKADWTLGKKIIIRKFEESYRPIMKSEVTKLRKKIPITCFNSNPLNILMWSHYADHHKGIMLEFKILKDFSGKLLPIPVNYLNVFPIIKMSFPALMEISSSTNASIDFELIEKALLRKSNCWEYEKEYRVFGAEKDSLLIGYDPLILSSVIIGTKFKSTNKFTLLNKSVSAFNKMNKTKVKIYETKLMEDRYELYVENHPRLDRKL